VSHAYRAVGWNRQKRLYDLAIGAGVLLFVGSFVGVGFWRYPEATAETLLIRGLGAVAILLLHIILSIGPLCRLDRRFLPLLYNRRHLGVTFFLLALAHGLFSIVQFHAFGDTNPLVSVLTSNGRFDSVSEFPFQPLGLAALVIFFSMAATSHDFWLANLTAPVWKALHMMVYVAYGLVLLHVALGALQSEEAPFYGWLLGFGAVWVFGLQIVAGWRERRLDAGGSEALGPDGFLDVCSVAEVPEARARIVCLADERVAVFRYGDKISAVSNVCQHQNGPLGEGRMVDGCIVCPWHGFQYDPASGASPPPFTERIPTFRVRVAGGRVWVHPQANPAGTRVEPAVVGATREVRG
jgi:nitrite reductase/ring-hydroxylating ferredoxin subunit/DMSO/TMAO reductase YedYZ heme-binding membrane subunit